MNKILAYTVIAILLGSVTMVVPLALLGPSNLIPDDSTDTLSGSDVETFARDNGSTSPEALTEKPADAEAYDSSSEEPVTCDLTLGEANVASELASIGLMIVPSFLVALGVFVYLKKRMT